MANVEALHKELNYTAYEPELKKNPSVFRTLAGARSKAQRDPHSLPRYRQLLTRAIEVLKASSEAEPDQIVNDAKAFWAFYDDKSRSLDIASREAARLPHAHQEWVEKNLPKTWAKFTRAVAQTVENGSPRSYDALRHASVDMLQKYIEGRE